jgi:hypothetical protein
VFLSTSVLVSLATATLAALPAGGRADGAAGAVCVLAAAECDLREAPAGPREAVLYATPAEVDCRAAVSTVAVNSRADLQLESGDCSPMTSDYRFHISRLPESPAGGSLAPQRVRRSPRAAIDRSSRSFGRSFCNGVPVPPPLASNADAPLPAALVSLPDLLPPAASWMSAVAGSLRPGRGSDPPEEPPRIEPAHGTLARG